MAPEPEHFLPKSAPEAKKVDPCFDISPKSPEIESALLHAIFILHTAPRPRSYSCCLRRFESQPWKTWAITEQVVAGNPVDLGKLQ